jgi:osmotically-inducible protein OsmY
MFIDPDDIQVSVGNGVVTLSGQVATRSEASMLEELTNRLDGVLGVQSELTWVEDV